MSRPKPEAAPRTEGTGAALDVPNSLLQGGDTSLEEHAAFVEEIKFFPPSLALQKELSPLLCPGFSSLTPGHGAEMGFLARECCVPPQHVHPAHAQRVLEPAYRKSKLGSRFLSRSCRGI